MLNIAIEKFRGFDKFFPINSTFEDYSTTQLFDLVFAASSFQWLSREDRLKRIADFVKPLGWFVRFKTVTILNPDFAENQILYSLYEKFIPDYLPRDLKKSSVNDQSYFEVGFDNILRREYFNGVNFTRDRYINFINTYTEYLNLDENLRWEFETAVKSSIQIDKEFKIQQKCSMTIARKVK